PAILPIRAAQARFHFTWLARNQDGPPAFEQPRQVFWVDRILAPSAILVVSAKDSLNAKPAILPPALIQEVDFPIKPRSPHQSRKCIDDAAELVLHSRSF